MLYKATFKIIIHLIYPPPPPQKKPTTHEKDSNYVFEMHSVRQRIQNDHYRDSCEGIEFGDYTYGNPRVVVYESGKGTFCRIGKFCSIAENVVIMLGGNHRHYWISTYPFSIQIKSFQKLEYPGFSKGNIIIGNDVWIGSGVKILSGVTIGNGSVIAANALVTKNIPSYSIYGGVPARFMKKRFSDDMIQELEKIKWWDWPDNDIANVVPILQSNKFCELFEYYKNNICSKG